MRLLTEDEFEEEVLICEDELVDDYLNERLSNQEKLLFEKNCLASGEIREKLDFAQAFKTFLNEKQKPAVKPVSAKKSFFNWRFPQFAPVPAMALVLLLCGAGFGVWYLLSQQSDVDKGLIALKQAYKMKRPFEARISDFEYAPLNNTRGGNDKDVADTIARDRAERILLDAVATDKNAASHFALGKLYLAEKNFEKAIAQFEQAERLASNDAKLQSDLGAVYLEAGKKAVIDKDGAKSLEFLDKSLKHLEKAIELNPKLLEPRFNRALTLEAVPLTEQAKQAWRSYLEVDANSKWADEARQHLQTLESQKPQNLSADELENLFMAAFREQNNQEAARLISQNRELIKEKYLPQRLAMSLLAASGEQKKEYLQVLLYAGELENSQIGDPFVGDIAAFYTQVPESHWETLKQSHVAMRQGYQLCLNEEYNRALAEFNRARELFLQVNNIWEAKLSEYFIVYCLIKTDQIKASLPLAEEITNFCRQRNYKWLLSNILYWFAVAQRATGERAKAKVNYKNCLNLAEEIRDPHIHQKILVELSRQSNFFGRYRESLNYLQRAFESGGMLAISPRQRWINYSEIVEIMADGKLYSLAKALSLENIQLVGELNTRSFTTYAQADVGVIHTQAGDFAEARKWLTAAYQDAETINEVTERQSFLAKCLLVLGHLERKQNNFSQAARFYDEALAQIGNANTPFYLYEIKKNRLLANVSLNNDAEVERQISETLNLAEKYREQISDEQERNSFFNNQQNIYDIAVANEFKHGRYEQAYNYLETSNSRSLLDWLEKGATAQEDKKNLEIIFNENAKPLQLHDIRAQIPEQVQIVQYAVVEDKVLIWLVSKDDFAVVSSAIDAEKLREKVQLYVDLVSDRDETKQAQAESIGRELYGWLISPIANRLDKTREICLIPHKILFHLPFAALTAPDGKPFLAEFQFFYSPSANVFLLCTKNAQQKGRADNEVLLSVGNPRFDRQEFADLQSLPAAEDEAREIARLYPKSHTLVGASATKSAFQNALRNAEIIHFAGHYIVRHGAPLSSSLLLARTDTNADEDVLTNAELIRQKLPQAKLVVLSACQTGVEQYYNGEGLVGLSRTFLASGAPLVVASQWKVDSDATAELMKKFHLYRHQEKLSTTTALRRAQLEMLDAPSKNFRQPYFWAAFAAFGGYAEF